MSIHVKCEPDGIPLITVCNRFASAVIALNGGQILEYVRHGEPPVLWMSQYSYLEDGKAIRGGVPIVWPWFGAHQDNEMPSHGFARLYRWEIESTNESTDGPSKVVLTLNHRQVPEKFVDATFDLRMTFIIGMELSMSLEIINTDNEKPLSYSCALHSYFNISEIREISINGLENIAYRDAVAGKDGFDTKPIQFDAELDRIYRDSDEPCVIHDPGYNRQIEIIKSGSNSTVVWNPWIEKSKRLQDFGDDEYNTMVCVETANFQREGEGIVLPKQSDIITSIIKVKNL